ncbi:MAG: hypothetical protein AVDCRST_MAG08-2364, partial [uncultured Acetobacteraceae bacterium]
WLEAQMVSSPSIDGFRPGRVRHQGENGRWFTRKGRTGASCGVSAQAFG